MGILAEVLSALRKFASDTYRWRLEHPCEAANECNNIADWAENNKRPRMAKRWRRRAARWKKRCDEQGGPCSDQK